MSGVTQEILDALKGEEGETRKLIAETCISICEILLKKNKDYGNSIYETPILAPHISVRDSILVRASDKVERFRNLKEGVSEVKDESILDTLTDLAGYLILYMVKESNEDVIDMDINRAK